MRAERLVGPAVAVVMLAVAVLVCAAVVLAYDARPARPDAGPAGPTGPDAPAVTGAAPAAPGATATGDAAPYAPDDRWVATTSAATGIPARALRAYARAHLRVAAEQPGCRVAWNTIAAVGGIESGHGRAGGSVLGDDGWPRPAIRGPALDGKQFALIRDSDGGRHDGDATWDRAVGPLQFIPSTWERWGADGNGDGAADPNQIDDAALAASRYLCHSGDLSDPATWRRAIHSFNHSDVYVADIAELANVYAARVG